MLAPVFLDGSRGRLHCARFLPPAGASDTALLLIPPFAEEMNKSRRMLAQLGHALATAGISTWLPDLYGTGDSEGEMEDADWPTWLADLEAMCAQMRAEGNRQLALGGMRTGALLAMQLSQVVQPAVSALLFWQPVVAGKQYLTQFLRLRQAAGMTAGGGGETQASLREALARGEVLEVAGYPFIQALAQALENVSLPDLTPGDVPVGWFDVASNTALPTPPATARVLAAWRQAGVDVLHERLPGDAFWATQELVDVPALIDASTDFLRNQLQGVV